ncbi:MAG: bifunctional phosphoribosylaminoimidazolecarboxamide formyltransferase/IMP cyclohydrolase [Candidatus Lindowbacteria bacterium RIFCSPLOWO2_12_FULL_62_27]|nr:MAG: bifunctional phosphoribosylaminoimidazolecarboxamide formyltransferase/IMP cyclohydrolase [Candidatus Lindowbacteria bacterium RIFCSPLOWO2_12_FULL_62_27]
MAIRNALISVTDREGLVPLAKILAQHGVTIYATGGTSRFLRGRGIRAREISALTKFPEILGGRVKTLHPAVFAGLLARPEDDRALEKLKFPRMDILVTNFYEFPDRKSMQDSEMAERIDIGGVALVRAAAKNYGSVLPIVAPAQYGEFVQRLLSGKLDEPEYRRRLAANAWGVVAQYDLRILNASLRRLGNGGMPKWNFQVTEEALPLRYGENPHQSASFFLQIPEELPFEVLQGKALSYCNLLDVHAAAMLWLDAPRRTFCAILKHTNPCGAAVGRDSADAFRRAFNSDPQSAFGGVVLFNRRVNGAAARELAERFLEVIVAPGYDAHARKILECKKSLRLIRFTPTRLAGLSRDRVADIRSALGGILVQDIDRVLKRPSAWKRMAGGKPARATLLDLDLAQRLAKHTKSNAIVLVRRGQAVGIGAGQQSRVDSVRIAVDKARRYGHSIQGAACASDGFFPFSDSIELLSKTGVSAVIEPGGSVRDPDVIAAARKRNVTLFFSGRRHFRH